MFKGRNIIVVAALMAALLSSCVPNRDFYRPSENGFLGNAAAQKSGSTVGAETVNQLVKWYNLTTRDCGSSTSPAFLCSGVMIRATDSSPDFLPWEPSPGSIESGGISFSWYRADSNFKEFFPFNNGFIFYPNREAPPGKINDLEVLCSFPYDAHTLIRDERGCGASPNMPSSRPCERQGINNGQQWVDQFLANPQYSAICGWGVRIGSSSNTANQFYQSIVARELLGKYPEYWKIHNEIRIETWKSGAGGGLPIQSFFYVIGDGGALGRARYDQQRYREKYGTIVPIIRLSPPNTANDRVWFSYEESDQVAGKSQDEGFESYPGGSAGTVLSTQRFDVESNENIYIRRNLNFPPYLDGNVASVHDGLIKFKGYPKSVKFGYQSVSQRILAHTITDKNRDLCCVSLRESSSGEWATLTAPSGEFIRGIKLEGDIIVDNVTMNY
ncbi:hypothetical protein [Burkholderia ubonensis]|nr:hypothetical protein [Burkholderia ubonensis]